ncbi:glycerophosphoryl diester phosphodiesterase [Blastococcus colisei]|uniref:Glycerophosphoryl diester phosphodiesterase n=1 Tax=Blastococcus colisei TaxID=1564162 RepID=A0A543PJ77_9ACTN|nr:glycerophosphodiester phosphodiesterase family protein [Blastococcus colisei]TQN44133.1 glycerophosphoryl diester phosphodiesterase [Blastococcus colisei]
MLRSARTALTGLFVTASLVGGASGALADQHSQRTDRTGQVEVIAHRGASAYAPENTLPAVDLGADMRADYVEIDVQMTSDGELVVMHDTTLGRTTDVEERYPDRAPWNVGDFTLEEIQTLDAGSWFGAEFTGTGVPTLQEVLDTLRGRAGLLLEVKSPHLYPGIAEAIVADLDGEGWLRAGARSGRLVVQSFDWEFMEHFNTLAPQVPAGLLGGPPSEAQMAELSAWADQINPSHTRVTPAFVETVHRYGMETWPYTVNNAERMRQLIDLGVDGIITNFPDVLIDVIEEGRGERQAA